MLKKIPRPFFWVFNSFALIPIALIILIVVYAVRYAADNMSLIDWGVLLALVVLMILLWWALHARAARGLPVNATALLRAVKHSHKYALLAFESEFCPLSMTLGRQAGWLEKHHPKDLVVYRLSVNHEPGRTVFKQYNGRATPTYILIDPHGEVVKEWTFVLPAGRVANQIAQRPTA